ncbi:MAG: Gfo/Idh/MocA family oxidoreductase [Planctomycetota bacterium]|nr:Gfo/Idh/MocA family oxidoreductase [Planctomycetota bacterium]
MSIRVGVIGLGRMGNLHCRVISEMPEVELACVVDTNADAAETAAKKYNVPANSIAEAVELVDSAVIATPTSAHMESARPFVAAGKAVLIEKPIADSVAAAEELITLSEKTGSRVQVGHTERFNPAVEAIRRFDIAPKFIEAHRISPFTFRSADIGVVLDMMIHDIDLVLMLAGDEPEQVQAVGVNVLGATEDIANARLTFPNGCVANLTASRLAIKSERKMRIFSEQAYLSVDYGRGVGIVVKKSENMDLIQMARQMDAKNLGELAGKVDYTKLIKVEQLKVADDVEPLRKQAEAFYRCVAEGAEPIVPAAAGLAAIRCAAAITDSIESHRWDGRDSERIGLDIMEKNR